MGGCVCAFSVCDHGRRNGNNVDKARKNFGSAVRGVLGGASHLYATHANDKRPLAQVGTVPY